MPTPDQTRIAADAAAPLIARLWRALAPLRSVVGFMNTGAHPDDETSAMLAALGLRDGLNLSYACSTRGEGGQNDIGTETGFDLGTLRTAEMERAAEVLDLRLYWLGQSAEDPVTDFGFSKSGEETMARWGHARTVQRFVEILRTERPDIICPTFLDIPGQHGHHRAMTQAAFEAVDLAADPAFVAGGLAPWTVSKLYLPAWSGAGGAYDDEVPPPEATVVVAGRGGDAVLGMSHARIGQQSRAFHRTQGMGRWVTAGQEVDWPLHLAMSRVGADAAAVTDNLPRDLADLDDLGAGLAPTQDAIAALVAAFPDRAAMLGHAARAVGALAAARVAPDHAHRIARKQAQLARVMRLCANPDARATVARGVLQPGATTDLRLESRTPDHGDARIAVVLPQTMRLAGGQVQVAADAAPSAPYPDHYDPLVPAAPALAVTIAAEGVEATSMVPFEAPPLIAPAIRAHLSQSGAILNLAGPGRAVRVTISGATEGAPRFALPEGWRQVWNGADCTLHAPEDAPEDVPEDVGEDVGQDVGGDVAEGLHALPLTIDGAPAHRVRLFEHAHIAPRLRSTPAVLDLRVTTIALPRARIGYIGAGNDAAATWLAAIGCDVTVLEDTALAAANPFAGFDTVLIGVFAMRFRPGLRALMPALHDWTRAGGTLVTLYHRPWDDWDPDTVPPARLEIGQPSLRWRVTDEAAAVTHLVPDHPILTTPNVIGAADWDGWHKERGLYFAKSWSAAYQPLLSMSDAGETPLEGALLSARIGDGRHTHVALILHHQMACLVPGAFRLMANILQPA